MDVKFLTNVGESTANPLKAYGFGELVTGGLESLKTDGVGEEGTW